MQRLRLLWLRAIVSTWISCLIRYRKWFTLQIHVMYFKTLTRSFPQPSRRVRHRPKSSKLFRRSNRRVPGTAEDHNRFSTRMCIDDTRKPITTNSQTLLHQRQQGKICLLPVTHLVKSKVIPVRPIPINKLLKLDWSEFLPEVLSMRRHMLVRCIFPQPSRNIFRVRHGGT